MFDSGELGVCYSSRTKTNILLPLKEYLDEDEPVAGPSGLRHSSLGSDRISESEQETPSGSEQESADSESEDEQEQIQLQPAENEIEGDFEYVCSLCWLLIVTMLNRLPPFLQYSRLIDSIRKSNGQQGSGVLSQAWDLSVNDDEDDWRDELRGASGIGRRKKKDVCGLALLCRAPPNN